MPPQNIQLEGFTGLTPEEAMIYKRLSDKHMAAQNKENNKENNPEEEEKSVKKTASDVYYYVMNMFKK